MTHTERTAYVFPGLGLRSSTLNEDLADRSPAIPKLWRDADAACAERLGFSLLRVLRENPRSLETHTGTITHPGGVVQSPCVAIVVALLDAAARVAELRHLGLFDEDALFCGHSVGEYSAITAVGDVFDLADRVEMAWFVGAEIQRGTHRNPDGTTDWGMGIVRPHRAGLDEAGLLEMVQDIGRRTGAPIEVVNYNLRDRLYSVVGTRRPLAELERRLGDASRGAWMILPGIDLPFHSRHLAGSVDDVRAYVDARMPEELDPRQFAGRLVPNLLPEHIDLADTGSHGFLERFAARAASPSLRAEVRARPPRPGRILRCLVAELFSWQYAAPVRWVETQERLLADVDVVIEVGPLRQPVLTNMLRATCARMGDRARARRIEHVGELLCREQDLRIPA